MFLKKSRYLFTTMIIIRCFVVCFKIRTSELFGITRVLISNWYPKLGLSQTWFYALWTYSYWGTVTQIIWYLLSLLYVGSVRRWFSRLEGDSCGGGKGTCRVSVQKPDCQFQWEQHQQDFIQAARKFASNDQKTQPRLECNNYYCDFASLFSLLYEKSYRWFSGQTGSEEQQQPSNY